MDEIENDSTIVSNAAYNLFYAKRGIDFENIEYERIKNVLRSESLNSQTNEAEIPQPSYSG